jgi:hypothetical protein
LPEALRALIPGRVVENRIAASNHGIVAAEGLPGSADARLQSRPVHLDAGARSRVLTSYQELAVGRIEIGHTIGIFADGRNHGISQTEI